MIDLEPHPDPEVEIVLGDLAEPSVVEASLAGGIAAIVHLAAVTSVLALCEHPERTYRTNVAATASLLEAARKAGVRALVFASTNAVVGPDGRPGRSTESVRAAAADAVRRNEGRGARC